MNKINPGGYALLNFGTLSTSGATIEKIYEYVSCAYNSGKMLIADSSLTKTPVPVYVISIATEDVELDEDITATFNIYTLGRIESTESDKNYINTITVRYNDEVKLYKTEITGGADLPEMTGHGGHFLAVKSDASGAEWKEVDLPEGSGNVGKYLMHSTTGNTWYDVREVPVSVASMAGEVLKVGSTGSPEWGEAGGGSITVENVDDWAGTTSAATEAQIAQFNNLLAAVNANQPAIAIYNNHKYILNKVVTPTDPANPSIYGFTIGYNVSNETDPSVKPKVISTITLTKVVRTYVTNLTVDVTNSRSLNIYDISGWNTTTDPTANQIKTFNEIYDTQIETAYDTGIILKYDEKTVFVSRAYRSGDTKYIICSPAYWDTVGCCYLFYLTYNSSTGRLTVSSTTLISSNPTPWSSESTTTANMRRLICASGAVGKRSNYYFPSYITSADAGKILKVNDDGTGFELVSPT